MSPNRLDPFGTSSKPMWWNLLEGTRAEPLFPQRNGVSWLEFGRIDDTGRERYFTIGARMRATKGTDGVALHLFVVDDARIGVDLGLTETAPDGSQRVLAPERMGELLRGRGDLFDAKAGGRTSRPVCRDGGRCARRRRGGGHRPCVGVAPGRRPSGHARDLALPRIGGPVHRGAGRCR